MSAQPTPGGRLARRTAAALALVVSTAPVGWGQTPAARAYVRDVGPGTPGRVLRDALSRPHDVIVAPDTGLTIRRDTTITRTLLIVGGPARVAATVRGDLVVVGDLFIRPGADVDGRAVAFGGGAYPSALASVRGGITAFRDVTFEAARDPDGAVALSFRDLDVGRARLVTLPGIVGVRIPSYTRIDGLAVTVGPEIGLRDGDVRVEPLLTYRSHLGALDPGVRVLATLARRTTIEARAERGTFTNDAWMRGDLVNSFVTLGAGGDVRNYYRADRGAATVARRFETNAFDVEPFVGALIERAWSAARDTNAISAPYSVFGRDDRLEGILRPNPRVTGGTIASALAGVRVRGQSGGVESGASAQIEAPVRAPNDARFAQVTLDGQVAFTAFADHRVTILAHALVTVGDAASSQRFAYLGGGPTLPSIPLLTLGGDRLLWTETRYAVPIRGVRVPFLGPPVITLRHMIGSAGVGRLPAFTQNLGLRLGLGGLRVDYTFDPSGRGERDFSVGVGFR